MINSTMHTTDLKTQDASGREVLIRCERMPALSQEYAQTMAKLADLGIAAFAEVEQQFLASYPDATGQDPMLEPLKDLTGADLDAAVRGRLHGMFHFDPEVMRPMMEGMEVAVVTIREPAADRAAGFVTMISGGALPADEGKITILAVDHSCKRRGWASLLVHTLLEQVPEMRTVRVSTRPSNTAAIAAYRKWGFVQDSDSAAPGGHFVKGHWVHLTRNLQIKV